MKEIIHIYGASGSGATTLGKKICKELGYQFMDTDNYFWMPTDPPYTTKRKWQKLLKCKQIVLNGADEIDLNFQLIREPIAFSYG